MCVSLVKHLTWPRLSGSVVLDSHVQSFSQTVPRMLHLPLSPVSPTSARLLAGAVGPLCAELTGEINTYLSCRKRLFLARSPHCAASLASGH